MVKMILLQLKLKKKLDDVNPKLIKDHPIMEDFKTKNNLKNIILN